MPDAPSAFSALRPGRSLLVGRGRELATLGHCLAEARAGRPGVVLLAGAPGIGKTRLLEEFVSCEVAEGVTVLRGAASLAEGMPPYLPFLEALGDFLRATPAEWLRELIGTDAPILATILPELVARLGDLAPPYPLPPEQERFRLYEAVTALLAAIAAQQPLVLVLDDLQWADAATCDLLAHAAGRLRASAVLVAGAYREGEADDYPAFVRALAELNRRRLLTILPLDALDADASRALAANLLLGEVAPEAADLLYRHGEGNPFFLEELVRVLVEDGALTWQSDHWELSGGPAGRLPPRVAEAIRLRLMRLDPAVVKLLEVAAVAGRVCEPALLASVTGVDIEQVDERLLVAAHSQLLRPASGDAYIFTHDMVRETLAARLGVARQRRLHRAIGEVLESREDDDSPQRLADLAFHFAAAGVKEQGATYGLAAGEQALRASAAGEAMTHYRTVIRLLGQSADDDRRATALTGLGDASVLAGDFQQAVDAYRDAQATWLRIDDPLAAAGVWYRLGSVLWRQEAVAEARVAFERVLELLGPDDRPDAARTLLRLADLHATSLARNTEAIAYAERALAMVETLGDRRLEAEACCVIGNVQARSNDLAAGQASLECGLRLAREIDVPALAAEACANLANIYAWTGNLDRSIQVSILRAELAQRTQDLFHLRHVYSWIGLQELLRGRWDDAEGWFARQEPIVDGLQSPEPRASLQLPRGISHYLHARFSDAERTLREIVELLRPATSTTLVWHLGWLGLSLAELGRTAEALACLMELHALVDGIDERARARGMAFAQLAVGYSRLGAIEQAAGCYARLLPFAGQLAPILIDRGLAAAARAAGDPTAARQHLEAAENQARRAGMLPELALTLLQRGLLEQDLDVSGDHLSEGLRLCAQIGIQDLGRRLLRPIAGEAPRRAGRGTHIAGLSDRELDVLRLVAQGLTNREIATALFLSENTVARHLTNIFNKTGVENRAGATAFALRVGLA